MSGGLLMPLGCALLLLAVCVAPPGGGRRARIRRETAQRLGALAMVQGEAEAGAARRALPSWLPRFLRVMLARADMVPHPASLAALGIFSLALGGLAGFALGWMAGVAGLLLPPVSLLLWLRLLARRRMAVLLEGLPFQFDALRQMMIAGSALQQALIRSSENADPGLRRFLLPMVRRLQNGAPVAESLHWLARRLDLPELHMLALAVQANMQYGGRLTQVLASLAHTLRDRGRAARELQAATAETRMSAMVIGGLPAVTAVAMMALNPSYLLFFRDSPDGNNLLMVALGLQLAGLLAIRRLMRSDY